MQDKIKTILSYLFVSVAINVVSHFVKSTFITDFGGSDLMTLLITIFAINVVTTNFIASKINEFKSQSGMHFTKSFSSLKNSLIEQVGLVVFSFGLLIFRDSKFRDYTFINIDNIDIVNTLVTFVILYFLSILWYTGKSMIKVSE